MTHKTLCTLVAPHCSQLNGVAHGAVACMVQLSSGLGFTELTVAIWGAPSFLGSLAKIAGTSGTRILFLVFTGMLFGRLTLFIHRLPLTKTQ